MNAINRKILMLRKGITQAEIARRLGVSGPTVSLVVSGRMRSRRVEQEIAESLGLPREILWPERK